MDHNSLTPLVYDRTIRRLASIRRGSIGSVEADSLGVEAVVFARLGALRSKVRTLWSSWFVAGFAGATQQQMPLPCSRPSIQALQTCVGLRAFGSFAVS